MEGRPQLLTSTTPEIPGYRVVESLGVVRGIVVRSRSVVGTLGGALQTLFGGNIGLFTDLCERTRAEAYDIMIAHAEALGANAVVAIHYDSNEVLQGVAEVLAYGTAVRVEALA